MSWSPLLTGAEAGRARAAIERIAGDLVALPAGREVSLARGDAGVGLALAVLSRLLERLDLAERAEDLVTGALEQVLDAPEGIGLWTGLAGVAWAAQQTESVLDPGPTAGPDDAPDDDDPLDAIDRLLEQVVDSAADSLHFELFSGLAGVGVYALSRLPRPGARTLLAQTSRRLCDMAVEEPDGFTWFTPPQLLGGDRAAFPDGYHSLGVAHGLLAPIAVLAASHHLGLGDPRTDALIESALGWLWQKRLPPSADSIFPSLVEAPQAHRAGWCYGDPGVACAIAQSAAPTAWRQRALDVALAVARRPVEQCRITDPTLCHGAFGLAHMLDRLGQSHGSAPLRDAARSWLLRGLDMQVEDRGVGGFVTIERSAESGQFEETAFAGMLDGAAGIALALAAAISPAEPSWDRAFLMSSLVPDPPAPAR